MKKLDKTHPKYAKIAEAEARASERMKEVAERQRKGLGSKRKKVDKLA